MNLLLRSKAFNLTNLPVANLAVINSTLQIDPTEWVSDSIWDTFGDSVVSMDETTGTLSIDVTNNNGSFKDLNSLATLIRDNLNVADTGAELLLVANGDLMTERPFGVLIKYDGTSAYKAYPVTFVRTEGVALA